MAHLFRLAFFCVFVPLLGFQEAHAYTFLRTKENGRHYYWPRGSFPVEIKLDKTGNADLPLTDVQQALQTSVNSWNAISGTLARFTISNQLLDGVKAPFHDGLNQIKFIKAKADWPFADGELANTVIIYKQPTGQILDADLVINDWNFQFAIGANDKWDLESTFTHELGHVFGLDHTNVADATMYFSANIGETQKRTLKTDDMEGVRDLYPVQACKEGEESGKFVCFNGRLTDRCAPYNQMCQPCADKPDCRGDLNFCLPLQDGQRCGYDCTASKSCPAGYTCTPITDGNGQTMGFNCVPPANSCVGAPAFACCRGDSDCLPTMQCINGECINSAACTNEGDACSETKRCCTGTDCVDDGSGNKCRRPCDPLSPRCEGNLRCGPASQDFSKGFCVPPNQGGKEGDDCDPQNKPCEYELGCSTQDKRCRLLCRPTTQNSCPADYRCVPVATPDGPGLCIKDSGTTPCTTAADCPTGRVCKTNRCSPCTESTDCPRNSRCSQGFCRFECKLDTDCPKLERCDSGLCAPGTTCSSNTQCPAGQVCQGNICTTPQGSTCNADADCRPGERCVEQRCRALDACNNLCTASETCLNAKCVPKVCASDTQCGQGFSCQNNACVAAQTNCGGQGPCPQGSQCINSTCRSTLGYICKGDESCIPGLSCIVIDGLGTCSKACFVQQASSCGDGFVCAEGLPSINYGCWPTSRADCSGTACRPKRTGCACTTLEPIHTPTILLLCFLLLFFRRTRSRYV